MTYEKADELPPVDYKVERSSLYSDEVQAQLKSDLGVWHKVEEGRSTRPSYHWAKQRFPGLQVATRRQEDGTFETWARFPA